MNLIEQCEESVLDAIILANRRYAKWSGGLWLNDAGVESMVCHALAEILVRRFKSHHVSLEVSYRWLQEQAGADIRSGRSPDLVRGSARADVVLFSGAQKPIYVFEIKRAWSAYSAWGDGLRICTALDRFGTRRGGSLLGGVFGVFNVRRPNSRRDTEDVESDQNAVMRELESWGFTINHRRSKSMDGDSDEGKWTCQGVCFSFR